MRAIEFGHRAVASLMVAFAFTASAQEQLAEMPPGCSSSELDLSSGNRAALALFEQRVRRPIEVGTASASMPPGFTPIEKFGALGDGIHDDTEALQKAIEVGRHVWLKTNAVYRISKRVSLGSGSALISDGSATLLMSAGAKGFNNRVALRTQDGIYSEHGEALSLTGVGINISDIFIVKDYEDERYVIAMDVRESSKVEIRRVRIRGFSLAPGIISIRSSDNVLVHSTLIHSACTESRAVPPDVASFQITGISVDDSRLKHRDSENLTLTNNVIADLRMIPVTYRGIQTDGINFAGIRTGAGSVIAHNDLSGVDEGLDLFGRGISVVGNQVAARLPIKLIHGASEISILENRLFPTRFGVGVGIYRAQPPDAVRQVKDVLIERNHIDISLGQPSAVHVDAGGEYPPHSVSLLGNTFVIENCRRQLVGCAASTCSESGNRKVSGDGAVCPKSD